MAFLILLILIAILGFMSYSYYKSLVNTILEQLVVLDKIFEDRYNDLSKAICQFQNYMPEQNSLIFDIQAAKAEVAKFAKPKTSNELAQKILHENSLTLNLNSLIDKCDFAAISPVLKEYVLIQVRHINNIRDNAVEYNKLVKTYNSIKTVFPFSWYSKLLQIDLNIDIIEA